MTHVKMLYDRNIPLGFEMFGHAGYGEPGKDIVCASLSAASQMTVNGFVEMLGVDCEDLVVEQNPIWGILKVRIPDNLHYNMASHCLLRSFEVYVGMLAEQYPQHINYERSDISGE